MSVHGQRIPDRFGRFRILGGLPSDGTREAFVASGEDGVKVVLEVWKRQETAALLDWPMARAAIAYARLDHPGLVRTQEVFALDGQPAIVRELVEGTTLDVLRAALARKQRGVEASSWVYVASCVFAALAAAHEAVGEDGASAPVLHERLDPSCVHIAWDAAVKLGHFSLGVVGSRTTESSRVRRVIGRYLAPEQLKLQAVGPETDVYSATLLLWELLTGQKASDLRERPGVAGTGEPQAPTASAVLALAPEVDPLVREVIVGGLEADPAQRTLSAARASEMLRSSVDPEGAQRALAKAIASLRAPEPDVASRRSLPPPRPSTPSGVHWAEESPTAVSVRPPALSDPGEPQNASGDLTLQAPMEHSWFETIRPPPPSTPAGVAEGVEPTPVRESRRRMGWIALASVSSLGLAIGFAAIGVAWRSGTRDIERPPPATLATLEVAPALPASAASPSSAPTVPAVPATPGPSAGSAPRSGTGALELPASAMGHRIFIDGQFGGDASPRVQVTCGRHTVRIGTAGRAQSVNIPCGGSIPLAP